MKCVNCSLVGLPLWIACAFSVCFIGEPFSYRAVRVPFKAAVEKLVTLLSHIYHVENDVSIHMCTHV